MGIVIGIVLVFGILYIVSYKIGQHQATEKMNKWEEEHRK